MKQGLLHLFFLPITLHSGRVRHRGGTEISCATLGQERPPSSFSGFWCIRRAVDLDETWDWQVIELEQQEGGGRTTLPNLLEWKRHTCFVLTSHRGHVTNYCHHTFIIHIAQSYVCCSVSMDGLAPAPALIVQHERKDVCRLGGGGVMAETIMPS
jgi:hypothetical protein